MENNTTITDEMALLLDCQADVAEHAMRTNTEHLHRAAMRDYAEMDVAAVRARAEAVRAQARRTCQRIR
jgi:hypothetical protein